MSKVLFFIFCYSFVLLAEENPVSKEIKNMMEIQKKIRGDKPSDYTNIDFGKNNTDKIWEKLVPVNVLKEDIPSANIKTYTTNIADLEKSFLDQNKNIIKNIREVQQSSASDSTVKKTETKVSVMPELDEKFHVHVVYLTPAGSPKFPLNLTKKTSDTASRSVFTKIPDNWKTDDTPYNSDEGHDHSQCLRITSGFYAGYYNNSTYGIHLKGHKDAIPMWGNGQWGGAWQETAKGIDKLNRRILFIIDVSNSMQGSDPMNDDRNCNRELALKRAIVANQENVDYGILFFHEKEKTRLPFTSYTDKTASKIFTTIKDNACRTDGGDTDMAKAVSTGLSMFQDQKSFDTIVLITDQSVQNGEKTAEQIRTSTGGVKIIANPSDLFEAVSYLLRI